MPLALGLAHRPMAVSAVAWRAAPQLAWQARTARAALVVCAAKKQQQPKKRKEGRGPGSSSERQRPTPDEYGDDDSERASDAESGSGSSGRMPEAPELGGPTAGKARRPTGDDNPTSDYKVFAARAADIEQAGAAWSWGDDAPGSSAGPAPGPPIPEWNPKTGFMGTSALRGDDDPDTSGAPQQPPPPEVASSSLTMPSDGDAPLPAVSKGAVLSAAASTGFWMGVLALLLRQYAQAYAPAALGTDMKAMSEMLVLPPGFGSWANLGLAVGAVGVVTGARLALLGAWPEFKAATNRSNGQVLQPLNWFDIALVAGMSGLSEEFLFRGAIIPASFPDWRGVLLSGAVFGLLHNSGGRNPAFAAWAGAVGCLYGGLFVVTHNIWVPATAHVAANFASAAVWKARNVGSGGGDGA